LCRLALQRTIPRIVLPQNTDLNLVRVFLAVYDKASVTRAAEHLCLVLPTVSYALGKLRELFDDPLFERTVSGMRPTDGGELVYGDFRDAMALIEHAVDSNRVFVPENSRRVFRLSMSDIGELVFLPPLLERLSSIAPQVQLEIVPVAMEQIPEMLASSRLDAAIGNLTGLRAGCTMRVPLFREHYVCLQNLRAAGKAKTLSLERFISTRHVLVSSPFTGHRMVEDALREHGVLRHIAAKTMNFTGLPGLLMRTDLIAVVPSRAATVFQAYGPLSVMAPPIEIPDFEVTLHWHERQQNVAAATWLRDLIVNTLRDPK
jgi:DNA-binding transcriptional LysR family regulator